MLARTFDAIRVRIDRYLGRNKLPMAAREMLELDLAGLPNRDPGSEAVIDLALGWLCRAQDRSKSADGGVARDYSLINGWASSYPETTGYIIPTFLDCAHRQTEDLRARARRMLEWLVDIQLPSGAFQGGKIDSRPIAPVTFNTGQIVLGLASGETAFGTYSAPLTRAADWLVQTQDADGCWRSHPTPFASQGEKTYETHVSWGLIEAEKLYPNRGYGEAALRNMRWAIGKQIENGWLTDCCLSDPAHPLTHTLAYATRGLLEGYLWSGERDLLSAAKLTADGMLGALRDDGFLPGSLNSDWSAAASWACLTGSAQIAHCWLLLHRATGDPTYLKAGRLANRYVRRTVRSDGPEGIRGGVKGSFPIDAPYGRFEYLNWAAKFLIDSLVLEEEIAAALEPARAESALAQ